MRVKVGETWYECAPGQPIMVELEEQDKINIADMHPLCKKYAIFDDIDSAVMSRDEMFQWMES